MWLCKQLYGKYLDSATGAHLGMVQPEIPGDPGAMTLEPMPDPAPAWACSLQRLATHLSQDAFGGPRPWQFSTLINIQKGGTGLFVLALMMIYRNWSLAAWTYLALHGSYGLCWLLKHATFPDARWAVRITWGGGLLTFVTVLGPYWLAPVLVITPVLGPRPEPAGWLIGAAVAVHTLGLALMLSADAQKHAMLSLRSGLITTGLYARMRHPNYLGEMLLYAAYALLARHWAPWLVLAFVWGGLFLPNMLVMEERLSRHPGWRDYKARTGFLFPRLRPPRLHHAHS